MKLLSLFFALASASFAAAMALLLMIGVYTLFVFALDRARQRDWLGFAVAIVLLGTGAVTCHTLALRVAEETK